MQEKIPDALTHLVSVYPLHHDIQHYQVRAQLSNMPSASRHCPIVITCKFFQFQYPLNHAHHATSSSIRVPSFCRRHFFLSGIKSRNHAFQSGWIFQWHLLY
jgi:hypothetical protein